MITITISEWNTYDRVLIRHFPETRPIGPTMRPHDGKMIV